MRIAILSDIHGNLPALEAVQQDLRAQQIDELYLLGDQISRLPWDNEVMDVITAHHWPAIYGNHELVIGRIGTSDGPPASSRDRLSALFWTHAILHPAHLEAIRALPATRIIQHDALPPIHLTHGVPGNPFVGFFTNSNADWLDNNLRAIAEPIVIVGHTHRPLDITHRRWRILNGGAVGLPFNGDTRAQYLILEARDGAWQPHFRHVAYDHAPIVRAFKSSGMLDALGAYGELHLLTAMTAQPWSSDFAWWHAHEPADSFESIDQAIAIYRQHFGPGRWAFPEPLP